MSADSARGLKGSGAQEEKSHYEFLKTINIGTARAGAGQTCASFKGAVCM